MTLSWASLLRWTMDNVAVIFAKDGVRIFHGINPADYAGRKDVLVNPTLPHGVPPHLWRLVDGRIEGTSAVSKPKSKFKLYLVVSAIGGFACSTLIHLFLSILR